MHLKIDFNVRQIWQSPANLADFYMSVRSGGCLLDLAEKSSKSAKFGGCPSDLAGVC